MADRSPGQETARLEAEAWFAALNQRKVSTRALILFQAWRRDPANAAAYRTFERRLEAPAVGDAEVREGPGPSTGRRRRLPAYLVGPGGRTVGGLLALVVAGAICAGALWLEGRGQTFRTAVGEQRMIRLEDGSRVRLDTNTRLRVKLERASRRVVLERGQAFFEVAHDPSRPFSVRSSGTLVRALGTRFDVRRDANRVNVTLVQGQVQVRRSGPLAASWVLTPGDQLELGLHGAQARVRRVDLETAVGWTTGRLVFRNAALADVTAEINRYSRRQVVLDAPAVARTAVNGSFESGDVEAFVAAACSLYDLRAIRRPDGTVVLRPAAAGD